MVQIFIKYKLYVFCRLVNMAQVEYVTSYGQIFMVLDAVN